MSRTNTHVSSRSTSPYSWMRRLRYPTSSDPGIPGFARCVAPRTLLAASPAIRRSYATTFCARGSLRNPSFPTRISPRIESTRDARECRRSPARLPGTERSQGDHLHEPSPHLGSLIPTDPEHPSPSSPLRSSIGCLGRARGRRRADHSNGEGQRPRPAPGVQHSRGHAGRRAERPQGGHSSRELRARDRASSCRARAERPRRRDAPSAPRAMCRSLSPSARGSNVLAHVSRRTGSGDRPMRSKG